jgi:hypothetical protein
MSFDPDWECYAVAVRPMGEESQLDIAHGKTETVKLFMDGVEKATLSSRNRTHSNTFYRKTMLEKPWIEELDQPYTYEGGTTVYTVAGSVSESFTGLDGEILFMDLRHDILVIKTTETSIGFSDSAEALIDTSTIDIGDRFSSQKIMDTVGLSAGHNRAVTVTETIKVLTPTIDEVLYATTETTAAPWKKIGISDYSGYIGALSWNGIPWGGYGYVDIPPGIIKNYGEEGGPEYQNSYEDPAIVNDGYAYMYWPGWLPRSANDTAKAALWAEHWGNTATHDHTVDVPVTTRKNLIGSCAMSGSGAFFGSLRQDDGDYWSKLLTAAGVATDPTDLLKENAVVPITFYPIAPV